MQDTFAYTFLEDEEKLEPRDNLRRSMIYGAWVILILNLGDLYTTFISLAAGGIEGNPIAEFLIYDAVLFGIPILVPLKILVPLFILRTAYRGVPEERGFGAYLRLTTATWFVAGVYFLVVLLNSINYLANYA